MDTVTIIVIVIAIVVLVAFMWPRLGSRRNAATFTDRPGNLPANSGGAFPTDRDARAGATPQIDRPTGHNIVADARGHEGDVVDEALDDIKSQSPEKSL